MYVIILFFTLSFFTHLLKVETATSFPELVQQNGNKRHALTEVNRLELMNEYVYTHDMGDIR